MALIVQNRRALREVWHTNLLVAPKARKRILAAAEGRAGSPRVRHGLEMPNLDLRPFGFAQGRFWAGMTELGWCNSLSGKALRWSSMADKNFGFPEFCLTGNRSACMITRQLLD